MRTFKYLVLALMTGAFTLVSTAGQADPQVPKEFGSWQRAKVGNLMTIKIPGKFKSASLDLDEEARKKIDSIESYSLDNTNPDDYQCIVSYTVYNKGIMADLDGGADGCVNSMKGDSTVSDFKVTRKYITRSKLKGIFLDGSFNSQGKQALFQSVIFVKKNVAWMVMIVDATDAKLPAVTKAIIDSVQIKPLKN